MIGPYLPQTFKGEPTLTCVRCDYCKPLLLRPGKNPDWQYECTHLSADLYTGGFIGHSTETPDWCPELKKNKEKGQP